MTTHRVAAPGPLAGTATPRGTTRFATGAIAGGADGQGCAPDMFRALPGGLVVGALGIGTHLGEPDDETDAQYATALCAALGAGVNLVDTAINYRSQRSERAIGAALRAAMQSGRVQRDGVVLCTKGGYVPLDGALPPTREAYRAYVEREYLAPRLLERADLVAGGHSITPAFLAHSLAQSRANLGVRCIDLYYLHNPEQQREVRGPTAFRTQLRGAVELLETKVAAGEIGAWGVATWQGLRVPPDDPGHLSLADVVTVAREVAGASHHLRAVQMPVNLAMPEAVRLPTQTLRADGPRVTALEAAVELGLGVVATAPLLQGRLTSGLPNALAETFPGCESDAQRALAFVLALPGVAAAVCGMRSPTHVAENLAVLRAREEPLVEG